MPRLERGVKAEVLSYLKTVPFTYAFSTPVSRYGSAGLADITAVISGFPVFIECKSPEAYKKPDHNLSAAQKAFRDHIRKAEGYYFVVDGVWRLKFEMAMELGIVH